MITGQPTNQMITALEDVMFTCNAKGFKVKYEWKRHNGLVSDGKRSNLTISKATPLDEDQYYCVAMTKGGYAFSDNVSLTVDGEIVILFITLTGHMPISPHLYLVRVSERERVSKVYPRGY